VNVFSVAPSLVDPLNVSTTHVAVPVVAFGIWLDQDVGIVNVCDVATPVYVNVSDPSLIVIRCEYESLYRVIFIVPTSVPLAITDSVTVNVDTVEVQTG
jgi:hypothetical protein